MDALLSDEELLLQATIDRQVATELPHSVREIEEFDQRDVWSRLAEGGFLAIGLPEQLGGAGTMLASSIVARSLGAAVAPVPYVGCAVLASQLLRRAGASIALLERLAAGQLRLAVGFDRDLRGIAQLGVDGDVVAFDCSGADAALVLDERGALVSFAVGDRLANLDLTRELAEVDTSRHVQLAGLGGVLAPEDLRAWTATALVAIASDLVGNMSGAVALGVEHALSRHQFGVPIGSFQALQHLIADAFVQADGARGIVNFAAWTLDHGCHEGGHHGQGVLLGGRQAGR